MSLLKPDSQDVRAQLERVLGSAGFARNQRLSRFLRFVIEQSLEGKESELKESVIAVEVFGRNPDYDPKLDSVVRTEAGRLRARLTEYYSREGRTDPIELELPKGGYVPLFRERDAAQRKVEKELQEEPTPHSGRPWAAITQVENPSVTPPSHFAFFASRNAALITLGAVCLLVSLIYWAWHRPSVHATTSAEKVVLAVLPFDDLNHDSDQEFLSDGLTEEMITQLSKVNPGRLGVVARGSVLHYKGSKLPVGQIGNELHANFLLQGSVRQEADRVRIAVQLIQVRDGTDLWAESYDRELKDILALQDSVAQTIASQIQVALVPAERTSPRKVDPEAYDAYLKGRYYWNKRTGDGMSKATLYFEQAISKDATNGAAYSGLADCNSGLAWHGFMSPGEVLPKAYAAAQKAVEIDPQSGEAHASLALVLEHKWDWADAEVEFKRALQLNPEYSNAHHWYGDYLSIQGRHDEAVLEARRALELDPTNLMIGSWLGLRYYLEGDYDSASEQGRTTVDMDPTFAAAHLILGESYIRQEKYKQGLDEMQKAATLSGSPLYIAQVGVGQALAGKKKEALQTVRELQNIANERYVSPYGIAEIYAALDDEEQTYKWLETAYRDRAVWMSYLAVDPVFDSIRSEAHFRDLLRRVGLSA